MVGFIVFVIDMMDVNLIITADFDRNQHNLE